MGYKQPEQPKTDTIAPTPKQDSLLNERRSEKLIYYSNDIDKGPSGPEPLLSHDLRDRVEKMQEEKSMAHIADTAKNPELKPIVADILRTKGFDETHYMSTDTLLNEFYEEHKNSLIKNEPDKYKDVTEYKNMLLNLEIAGQ